jgi:hypothetical protein
VRQLVGERADDGDRRPRAWCHAYLSATVSAAECIS